MNITRTIILSILVLFTILSCNHEYNNEGSVHPDNFERKGTITINVPLISPGFTDAWNRVNKSNHTGSKPARAYAIANRIEFTLLDSGDNEIDTYTHYPEDDGCPVLLEEADTKINIIVTEGTGYSIDAEVFNTTISTTVPVVTGNSGPFDVVSGQITQVIVRCVPYNPEAASENTTYSFTTTPTYISFDSETYEFVSTGGEKWYEITPSTYSTIIEATPDSANYCTFSIYNNDGSYITMDTSFNTAPLVPGLTLEFLQATTPGLTYYIGVIPITITGEDSCTVDLCYYPGPPDTDEENDDFATATALDPDTPVTGLNLDDDYYIFTIDDQIGLDIILTLTILNEPEYHMYLTIYDNLEDLIDWEGLNEGESQLVYPVTLDTGGDYYLLIDTSNYYKGAQYTIEWTYQ